MISRMAFWSAHPATIRASALGADPGDLAQSGGLLLDEVEHGLTEGCDQRAGIGRADAADHAGAEVFLDAIQRWWAGWW